MYKNEVRNILDTCAAFVAPNLIVQLTMWGRSRCVGFAFDELSCHPSSFKVSGSVVLCVLSGNVSFAGGTGTSSRAEQPVNYNMIGQGYKK